MDRETESRSKLDKFHVKQTVQKIMHRFLELYQDFEWKYQTVQYVPLLAAPLWSQIA